MTARARTLAAVALTIAAMPPLARADQPACADPARAPDPRCGDELDGRGPPAPPETSAPKVVLAVPRYTAKALFWPVVWTSGFLESHRVFPWMKAVLTTDDGLIGVRPELQYATGFLPTLGLRLFDRRLPLPGAELVARARTAGPTAALAQVVLTAPPWLGFEVSGTWSRRSDYLFAGVGPTTEDQLEAAGKGPSRYGADALAAELRWARRLGRHVAPAVHGDFERRDYGGATGAGGPSIEDVYAGAPLVCAQLGLPGGCVDPSEVPGFNRGLRVAHAGAGLTLDFGLQGRDGGGFRLAVDGTYGQGVQGDPTRLVLVRGEALAAVGGLDRLLIARVNAADVEPILGTTVPFEELVSPSGQLGIRGLREGRLRDHSGLVGTLEYRWFVAFNIDASLFVDVGTVAGERFAGLASSHLFPSFGVGLRRYATLPAHYWLAPPGDGLQLAYAPDDGFRALLSVAAF